MGLLSGYEGGAGGEWLAEAEVFCGEVVDYGPDYADSSVLETVVPVGAWAEVEYCDVWL